MGACFNTYFKSENLNPLFSIIMPVYNRDKYIEGAIASVLEQSFTDFELIVVDDGSTDNTLVKIKEIDDPKLRLLCCDHKGGAAARNKGLLLARGKFVVWIDSDDIQSSGALDKLNEYIKKYPDVDVFYGDLLIFGESDSNGPIVTNYPDYLNIDLLPLLINGNCLPNPGTAVRRDLYKKYGGYDESFTRCHDYQMWTRLANTAKFKKVDAVLCHWRQHGTSLSNTKSKEFEGKVVLDVFSRYPVSRLFIDVTNDKKGRAESCWRVSCILKDLQEFTPAIRMAYKAGLLGYRSGDYLGKLIKDAAGSYQPLFSIILTTFNRPELLAFALSSLEGQTLKDFEVVLVNDCGAPVERLIDNYSFMITYIKQGVNQGLSAARNAGLKLARGSYICYLDDDDVYLSNHLEVLAEGFYKHPQYVAYTGVEYVRERLDGNDRIELSREVAFEHDEYDVERLFIQNYIPVNTWAHPRNAISIVGEFDTALSAFEDWDMLMRLAVKYSFLKIPQITAEVHLRDAPNTGSDHMLGRESKNFGALYKKMYQRHSDLGSQRIRAGRASVLEQFDLALNKQLSVSDISQWLKKRKRSIEEKELVKKYIEVEAQRASVTVFLLDINGSKENIEQVLASLVNAELSLDLNCLLLTVAPELWNDFSGQVLLVQEDLPAQLNQQLCAIQANWVFFIDASDVFCLSGLQIAEVELSKKPALNAISFDAIYREEDGVFGAALRTDVNLDYLLSFPAGMSKHWLFNRQALLDIGGFNPELPDAFELDAILRLINHGGLEGLGHIAEPLVITQPPALANIDDERKAIEAHLQQRGYVDAQVHAPKPGRYQIRYNHPQQPIVSIVLIAEASLAHMQRCVEGLLSDTTYQNFEVLLFATQNTSSKVSAWLAELASLQEAKLRIFNFPEGDLAEQCNQAALQAIGDYLLFLSADTSVISAHWLDELLNHAQRGEVGIVGAKLVSPIGKIAHAGHILGLEGPLGSPFVGEDLEAPGYMQRLQVDQNLSAVGIDCFMVLRELFVELDGFTENQLATEYLSADFCLRAREAGFLTVWTPHAQLMLDREVQPRPSSEQQDAMYAKWLPQLARDPAYNPNFSLSMPGGFKLADSQISWRPLESFRPEPVALVHPADLFGCGHYRVMQPFLAMKEAGLFDGAISTGLMHVTDLERYNPDTIILQRQIGDERLEAMQRMQRFSKAFKVYELDDYLPNLPLKSVHRANMPKDILRSLRKGLSFVDRFVVSTGALAEAFSGLHNEIVVMENRLPVSWWQGLQTQRRQGKKPRVGWAGGSSHTGDLELIADVVRDLADEVEWVFFGMCPDKLRPYVHEYHDGVAIEQYPAKLASLNLDLGLAPLEMNLFNECKSNLRLLEYGACGIPVVCTDIRCYQNDFPVTRVRNRYKDWVDAIRLYISDLDTTAKLGDELQAKVRQEWMLEGVNLELWRKTWLPN